MVGEKLGLVSVVRCRTSCPLRVGLAVARPSMPYPRTYMLLYKCTQIATAGLFAKGGWR